MQGSAWIKLIRRIPENQHDNLVAVTAAGSEIMVQRILVVEEDIIIFRGRPAGSTDQPRILLMPFDQLNHIAFHKALPEPEVLALFGNGSLAAAAPPVPVQAAAAAPPASEAPSPAAAAEPSPPAAAPEKTVAPPAAPAPAKAAPPSKSVLLARLRARLAGDAPKS